MHDEHTLSTDASTNDVLDEPAASSTENRSSRKAWPRFSDERRFGSITGSDFRIRSDE